MSPANMKKIVFFDRWVDPIGEQILAARADIDFIKLSFADDDAANWLQMNNAHGFQLGPRTAPAERWLVNESLLSRAPNLLAVCSMGAGYDLADVDACTRAGVIICNQSGTNQESVAEHTIGFIIALSKKIGLADHVMRRQQINRDEFQGNDIRGKTVGIIGLGFIGTRTAKFCRAFEMPVLAYDPYLTESQIAQRGATKVSLDDLLRNSDFVSVHCPKTSETIGMMDAPQFALMKPTAFFVTTARGGIHSEDALVDALKHKRIAGAGLDVFLKEPPAPDHPLFQFDNVIATPHNAGVTTEALRDLARAGAEQWLTLLDGKVPPRLVNPQAWPLFSERFQNILGVRPAALPRD